MSFRLFIYYCAICGAWAAFFGWGLGKLIAPREGVGRAGIQAMYLGLTVGFGLGLVDALWNLSRHQMGQIAARVAVAVVVGSVGGLIGGVISGFLFNITDFTALKASFQVFGWTIAGFLVGASVGVYDVLARVLRQEELRGALRKIINGVIGGTVGGLVGGILFMVFRGALSAVFKKEPDDLLSSSALGFVVLGMCIGLLIGLAQVILKEAWIRVEAGFRPGRELILTKPQTVIGRAEGCDIGLFGGQGVERIHARILQHGPEYVLADANTPGGTFVNDERLDGPRRLYSGDVIRLGNCVLRFQERKKRTSP